MSKMKFSSAQSSFVCEFVAAYDRRKREQYEHPLWKLDAGDRIRVRHPLRHGEYVAATVVARTGLGDDEQAAISTGQVPAGIWCGDDKIRDSIESIPFDEDFDDLCTRALVEAELEEDVHEACLRRLLAGESLTPEARQHRIDFDFGRAVIDLSSVPARLRLTFRCILSREQVRGLRWLRDLREAHQGKDRVESVAVVDDVLEPGEIAELSARIDELAKEQVPEYHPGSDGRLRDIIHPSLFCYVEGRRWLEYPSRQPGREEADGLRVDENSFDRWGRNWSASKLRWLPAEVDVDDDGQATFVSPINCVDRDRYPGLYAGLEGLLTATIPAFSEVLGGLRERWYGACWEHDLGVSGRDAPHVPVLPRRPLRGRRLQVIVKVLDYELRGGIAHEGAWQVAGISDEHIVATAAYVLACDEGVRGGRILFGRQPLLEEGNHVVWRLPRDPATRMSDEEDPFEIPLGAVQTTTNRAVVFPNSHIHRLDRLVADTPSVSRRRVIVFSLVDPDQRILSTDDVEPQDRHITREQAREFRLLLTKERADLEQHYNSWTHELNF